MNLTRTLRILIAAEILLGVNGIVADAAGEMRLPQEIQAYAARSSEAEFTAAQTAGVGLGILLFIGLIVGWIGLWRLWRPARMIYTLSWLVSFPIYLLLDPVVYYTPAGAVFSDLSILASGIIIGLIFFSDLSTHFEPARAEQGVDPEV